MKRVLLYPLWLRIWHWLNAILFIILILSGTSMHYSATNELFLPFDIAMYTHNVVGILLSLNFIFYTVINITSGNYKQYIPTFKNFIEKMFNQTKYYVYGVFKGHPHPYHTSKEMKFNPLQQLTYFSIMFFLVPIIIITGWLLMFPELAPPYVAGMGGVWPMAVLHIIVGFFLSVFMFGHIYLATHGETVTANFKSMIDGYHNLEEEHEPKLVIKTGNITAYNDDTEVIDFHQDYKVIKEIEVKNISEKKEIKKFY